MRLYGQLSRRDLMRGAAATVLLAGCRARDSAHANLPDPSTGGRVDLDLQLRASARTIALDGIGGATEVWAFDGQLVSGPRGALTADPASCPDATIAVDRGSYRLRVINGSNARIYRLAWSNDAPITVIGTDGGLIAAASDKPYVMLAPGERLELWVDFASVAQDEVRLESRAFDAGTSMGMGGMMGGRGMGSRNATPPAPPNGAALGVCRFAISGIGPRRTKPTVLTQLERISDAVVSAQQPHRFYVSMSRMRWQLNGSGFAMTEFAANERFKVGATEDWEFTNPSNMMAMPHPIHVHGAQFQIVSRSGAEPGVIDDGMVDDGWKDTFLLRPGERVRIRRRSNHAGLFLYHCHNLEHEDAGMMRNFLVET